jgi:hypothetical protein
MPERHCDVPGCDGWVVKHVGDQRKCRIHAIAAAEEWALAYDWKCALLEANIDINRAICSLQDGRPDDSWAQWIEAWTIMRAAYDTKRLLIKRGFFHEAGV